MNNCLPDIDTKIMKIIPKHLKNKFPNVSCCMKIQTDWIKRPVDDIICSAQGDGTACNVEILILRATIYQRCIKQGLNELNVLIEKTKNTRNLIVPKQRRLKYYDVFKNLGNIKKSLGKINNSSRKAITRISRFGKQLKRGAFNYLKELHDLNQKKKRNLVNQNQINKGDNRITSITGNKILIDPKTKKYYLKTSFNYGLINKKNSI